MFRRCRSFGVTGRTYRWAQGMLGAPRGNSERRKEMATVAKALALALTMMLAASLLLVVLATTRLAKRGVRPPVALLVGIVLMAASLLVVLQKLAILLTG